MKAHYIIKSLSEYVKVIDSVIEEWSKSDTGYIYPWFRGHSNHNFSLLPGIYRKEGLLENEDSYRQDFMFKAHPFLDQSYYRPTNHAEWYFLMQHYGMPTRLLDWTEGSLIALHFAINTNDEDVNKCVWMLNPFKFNKVFNNKDEIFTNEKELKKYIPELWTDNKIPKWPLAIQPQINSKRISSQKGCFMLFGSEIVDLTSYTNTEDYLVKIEIDNYPIEQIRDSLIVSGLTESMIYPELSGLAKELINYYRN